MIKECQKIDMTTQAVPKETQPSKPPVLRLSSNEATISNSKRKQLSELQRRISLCNCSKRNRNVKFANSRRPVKE